MRPVHIATEDALSEAVVKRLILEENHGLCAGILIGRRGSGYLRAKLEGLARWARSSPVFLLADLDRGECPVALVDEWSSKTVMPGMMLFRIAVREVEAWLLADQQGFSRFTGVPFDKIPRDPESLDDPKEILLNLVRRHGGRSVKADILPSRRSTAKVGLAYNQALCAFVEEEWSPDRAEKAARSLRHARLRLRELRLDSGGDVGSK